MLLNCVTVFSVSSSFTPWVEVSIFVCCKDVEMQCHLLLYRCPLILNTVNYLIYTPYQKKASCLIDAPLQC